MLKDGFPSQRVDKIKLHLSEMEKISPPVRVCSDLHVQSFLLALVVVGDDVSHQGVARLCALVVGLPNLWAFCRSGPTVCFMVNE